MFETSPVQKQDIDHIDAQLGTIIELLEKIILLWRVRNEQDRAYQVDTGWSGLRCRWEGLCYRY